MSLKLGQFGAYLVGSSEIAYLEVRNGEQYAIPVSFTNNDPTPQPINLQQWTFSVTYDIYTANFNYDASGNLVAASNFTDQGPAGQSYAGLEITNIQPLLGTAVLKIPAGINPNPSTLVTADGDNTMLNIITITANYPSVIVGFPSVRKLLLGLVVRFG